MGTRGCIARLTEKGFEGRYHHWDSYPSGLGESLWKLYHGHFKENLENMLKELIDKHPAGWSTICGRDFSFKAGFIEHQTSEEYDKNKQPLCFCHGDRKEKEWLVTEKDASDSGVEWVYAFDVQNKTMQILASYNEDNTKMIGMFGCGNPDATWKIIKIVELDGKEPDWKYIEDNVRDESHQTYENIKKKEIAKFLSDSKEAFSHVGKLGLGIGDMAYAHYLLWYMEDVKEHLLYDTKMEIAKRISELTLRNPIWEDRETNYIKDFPELEPHSSTKQISGLQLCAVLEGIVKNLQEGS
jgi:hypothetical protein